MPEDERVSAVKQLLFEFVKSPSLHHIRDPHFVIKLAKEIVKQVNRGNSIWRKWDGQREVLLRSAVSCWIPVEDLRDFLNRMPGPPLTTTDVAQRLKAFEEEQDSAYSNEELKPSCQALYDKEKAEGTELPAIIGLLRDHAEREKERSWFEQRESYQRNRDEERIIREQRFFSGADCAWTRLQKSAHRYCHKNGRTYRLSPTKDKMWNLLRVNSTSDSEKGSLIGKYQRRRDATKVVDEMAYQPDIKW